MKLFNSDNESLQLTIYTNNLTMIKEIRHIPNSTDSKIIEYYDISHYLDETSVIIINKELFEINFSYECNKTPGNCHFPNKKSTTLTSMLIFFNTPPTKYIETYYITPEISWDASYSIVLNEKDLNCTSWFNIKNSSGITYNDATIKCVSGEINTVNDIPLPLYKTQSTYAPTSQEVQQYELEDYYVYLLNNKYTLKNNSTKRIINFLNLGIKYDKIYDFGYYDTNAKIILQFENAKENMLGIPLTKGTVDVYTNTTDGLELLGKTKISNTPIDTKVSLDIGKAFDLTCERKIIDYKKDSKYEYKEIEFVITNRKASTAPIKICCPIFTPYEMVFSSDPYEKNSQGNPCYNIIINNNDKKIIKFGYKTYQT